MIYFYLNYIYCMIVSFQAFVYKCLEVSCLLVNLQKVISQLRILIKHL